MVVTEIALRMLVGGMLFRVGLAGFDFGFFDSASSGLASLWGLRQRKPKPSFRLIN